MLKFKSCFNVSSCFYLSVYIIVQGLHMVLFHPWAPENPWIKGNKYKTLIINKVQNEQTKWGFVGDYLTSSIEVLNGCYPWSHLSQPCFKTVCLIAAEMLQCIFPSYRSLSTSFIVPHPLFSLFPDRFLPQPASGGKSLIAMPCGSHVKWEGGSSEVGVWRKDGTSECSEVCCSDDGCPHLSGTGVTVFTGNQLDSLFKHAVHKHS